MNLIYFFEAVHHILHNTHIQWRAYDIIITYDLLCDSNVTTSTHPTCASKGTPKNKLSLTGETVILYTQGYQFCKGNKVGE